jgi:YD repeat-containing protein
MTETWETDTTYGGNYTTVVPPSGGTSETTLINGEGQTSAIYQYHAGVTASPSDPASDYDATMYSYTSAGQLEGIADADGNTWSYSYDLAGDQTSATDPDAGTTNSTYDAAGQLMTVTDMDGSADGNQVSYTYDSDGRKTAEYNTTSGALESSADEIASWTYDTLAKGELTSSTSYYDGSDYTVEQLGYNDYGESEGTETLIPEAQGKLYDTYIQETDWYPEGQLESVTDSAAGGLPAEEYSYSYNAAGEPTSNGYVDSLSYTELGQPLEYTYGSTAEPVWVLDSYDPETNRLTGQETATGTSSNVIDDLTYSYNDVGDVTSEADLPSGDAAADDVQCFQYDYLGRLTQGWSRGTSGCSSGPSQSAEATAAAPYWEQYSYNAIGDMTSEVSTPASGSATTTTESYPATGSAQPHAISSETVDAPSGDASASYEYDDSGQLTSVTGSSEDQSLSWNPTGTLASDKVTPSSGTAAATSNIYDADGNLLIQKDPDSTTLFLKDEELVLNDSTDTVTGTRFYALGGVTTAVRTGSDVSYLIGDEQGTDTIAIADRHPPVLRSLRRPDRHRTGLVARRGAELRGRHHRRRHRPNEPRCQGVPAGDRLVHISRRVAESL